MTLSTTLSGAPFLIVDDEPEMCWALALILTRAGGVCHTAVSANEALALAETHAFGMAFLDAKLPDTDGLDLALRLQESTPGIRCVIVTGYFYRDDPVITEAIRSGRIEAFIAKPFAHAEILRAVGKRECPPAI